MRLRVGSPYSSLDYERTLSRDKHRRNSAKTQALLEKAKAAVVEVDTVKQLKADEEETFFGFSAEDDAGNPITRM